MPDTYDIVVAGLGAMGSAAACYAAGQGLSVAGFDRWTPPHLHGSTHGHTRAIRRAYYENDQYVPLVVRAWELWEKLGSAIGRELLLETGALYVGPPDGELVGCSLRSARRHEFPHRQLAREEVREQYPQFAPGEGEAGMWENYAGVLFPERCVESCLELAAAGGAQLHYGAGVTGWRAEGDGLRVETEAGVVLAGRLVLATGPWIAELVPELNLPVTHKRMIQFWFRTAVEPEAFGLGRCPVFVFEYEPGKMFYGFPDLGGGVKAAFHTGGTPTTPEEFSAPATPEEINELRRTAATRIPALAGAELTGSDPCIYTMLPGGDSLIDKHPEHEQVIVLSACSGHGFKFATALGQAAVQLATDGESELDLSPFGIGRLLEQGRS